MGITANLQLGGDSRDIAAAYTVGNSSAVIVAGDSPYTVDNLGSTILYVDSSAGPITINPYGSPLADERLKVIAVNNSGFTNNITVTNIGTINNNNGSIEGRYSGSAWQVLEDDVAMTDAEIKTAYENNANTNAFTDADEAKLDQQDAVKTVSAATYDILETDHGKTINFTYAGAVTITCVDGLTPTVHVTCFPSGASTTLTFAAGATGSLDSKDGNLSVADRYAAATLVHGGSNAWYLFGDLS